MMVNNSSIRNTICFVLRAQPYKETSLLVEALSADMGRISFVARGARSVKSQWKAMLQLFVPLKVTLDRANQPLKTLTNCEMSGEPFVFLPPTLFSALYINELTGIVYHVEEDSEVLFAAYLKVLKTLNDDGEEELALRQYEETLLSELGYGVNFDIDCENGAPIREHAWYFYQSGIGFTEIMPDMIGGININEAFNGSDIINYRSGINISSHAMKAVKNIFRISLVPLLKNHQLKSRELYRQYVTNNILEDDRDNDCTTEQNESSAQYVHDSSDMELKDKINE